MTQTADPLDPGRMSLIEHLAELRTRLVISVISIAVGAVACWILYPQILDFLTRPYDGVCEVDFDVTDDNAECQLLVTDPLEGFNVRVSIAAYGGLAIAMPVLLWQLWAFISPGLYPHERRYGLIFTFTAAALFFSGAALAYWSIPRALDFLDTIGGQDLVSFFSPDRYFNFVVKMMIAFGLGFEFPIILIFLQMADLLETQTLSRNRHYAIIGIVVLVAVITPSGDPFTLMVLSVPMYIFYEASIVYGRLRARRKRRAGATA